MTLQTADYPLIVVSNRLPITLRGGSVELTRSSGGLVAALDPALQRLGGTWVGWPGSRALRREALVLPDKPYRIKAVELSETEMQRYYYGFSNRTLWPLFHSLPERAQMLRSEWETYDAVNRRFAEVTAEVAEDDSLIWVQDYHLLRMSSYLRERIRDACIAFFLHIPFPPFDVYRILPWSRELLRGLMACDLIGFHCPGYVTNFLDCVERLLGARVDRDLGVVQYGDRTVRVGAFPMGIDVEAQMRRAEQAPPAVDSAQQLVLGVDRLDYTKGIPERILAFERMLELHPNYRERVVFLQLVVPSRGEVGEYRALKRELDEVVGRVNGRFATPIWTPIQYLYRSIPQDRLAVLYRNADVALVTPLRDGMNLVAKEFVASQLDNAGVLILSWMAGAAETMHEALQVNPYNIDGVAETLHRALSMDGHERSARMHALQQRERRNDLYHWLNTFLAAARESTRPIGPATGLDFESWLGAAMRDRRLALFLDYDGTLAPIVEHADEVRMPEAMREALEACVARPDYDVAIVSGRPMHQIEALIGLPGVTYVGNHGLEISGPGLEPFSHPDVPHYRARAKELAEALKEISVGGSWVEEKGPTLTLHYRQVPQPEQGSVAEDARWLIRSFGFQSHDGHCIVEARPPIGWDKGHAVLHTLRNRYGPSWSTAVRTIYVGDDQTDEDAFRVLAGLGFTFRIGGADTRTEARRVLSGIEAVQNLLEWLTGRPLASS
jgi:trehalose 6-phosphate synthase/phosphatase